MTDQTTHPEPGGEIESAKRIRFYNRIGIASLAMILYCITIPVLILLLAGHPDTRAANGLIPACLRILRYLALPSFLLGTFMGSVWVFRELAGVPAPGQTGRRMTPMVSLLLTGRLHSLPTNRTRKDMVSFALLLVLLGALILGLGLSILWQ